MIMRIWRWCNGKSQFIFIVWISRVAFSSCLIKHAVLKYHCHHIFVIISLKPETWPIISFPFPPAWNCCRIPTELNNHHSYLKLLTFTENNLLCVFKLVKHPGHFSVFRNKVFTPYSCHNWNLHWLIFCPPYDNVKEQLPA